MFRVALIAYLSLTTVFGPALCCCNARQFFGARDGSQCCGKPAALHSDAPTDHHAVHDHHCGQAHHQHEQASASSASEPKQSPAENEQDGQNCPCGNHHASLVAAAISGGVRLNVDELQTQTWFVLVAPLPVLPEYDAAQASRSAHLRPVGLYGREMLRAYSIMRC